MVVASVSVLSAGDLRVMAVNLDEDNLAKKHLKGRSGTSGVLLF